VKLKDKPMLQDEDWTTFGERDEAAVEGPLFAAKAPVTRLEPVHHAAPDDPLGIYLKDVGAHDLLEPEEEHLLLGDLILARNRWLGLERPDALEAERDGRSVAGPRTSEAEARPRGR
jgi:hypothetical protein